MLPTAEYPGRMFNSSKAKRIIDQVKGVITTDIASPTLTQFHT